MSKVLKIDASVAAAYVEKDLGSDQTDLWATFLLRFDAAARTFWDANDSQLFLAEQNAALDTILQAVIIAGSGVGWEDWVNSPAANVPTANVWHLIEMHYAASAASEFYVDSVLIGSGAIVTADGVRFLDFGQFDNPNEIPARGPAAVCYIDDVKVGTSRGAQDLFHDDFESGTFAAWTSTSGDVSIVDDPFPVIPLHGISFAPTNAPLDDPPTWERIDLLPAINIQRVSITRGRPDETEKTSVGKCTIYGIDAAGILDPTNTSGPYYGNLDPVKQVGVALFNPVTSAWSTRFVGYWDELTYTIHPSGKFATFRLDCVDALDILADAEVVPGYAGASPPPASVGNSFYSSQQVNDRILAALADASNIVLGGGSGVWPSSRINVFSGNVALQDSVYSPRSPSLQVIQDAADGEFPMVPNFYIDKNGVVTFHGRYARFNPHTAAYNISFWKVGDVPAFDLDDQTAVLSSDDTATPLVFTRGKKNLINAALCAPQGIAAAAVSGQLVYDTTSIAAFGVRNASYEGLLTLNGDETPTPLDANDETKLMATYLVDNYKTPQNRPQTLTIRSKPPDHPHAARNWAVLAGIDLNDVVTLTTTHPGGGGFAGVDFFVEQIREEWVPRSGLRRGDDITLQLEVSPRAFYDINPFSGDPPPSS